MTVPDSSHLHCAARTSETTTPLFKPCSNSTPKGQNLNPALHVTSVALTSVSSSFQLLTPLTGDLLFQQLLLLLFVYVTQSSHFQTPALSSALLSSFPNLGYLRQSQSGIHNHCFATLSYRGLQGFTSTVTIIVD